MAVINGNLADGKPMQYGGFYNGRAWNGKELLAPGLDVNGNKVSNEVIAQTNPANVQYIQAQNLQAPVTVPNTTGSTQQFVSGLTDNVANARKAIEDSLGQQKATNDAELAQLKGKEQEALKQVGVLTTPFRENLEKTERERLYINENFEANQKLVSELETLLTEGNNLIRQQQGVTGLAAIRNPRIQQTMNDVAARAGVIQAVMNARNGQIAQAQTLIDRTINAISADRQDQISYYETIISLNRQDMLSLDNDNKRIAEERLGLLKNDLGRAEKTADYVKELMINPDTAYLMAQGGVTLNDDIKTINTKLANAQYQQETVEVSNKMSASGYTLVYDTKGIPANQLVTITDSRGKTYTYRKNPTGSGGFNTSTFLKSLEEQGYKVKDGSAKGTDNRINVDMLWDEVLNTSGPMVTYGGQPNFAPAGGFGTIWNDPKGGKWKYTQNGWVRV